MQAGDKPHGKQIAGFLLAGPPAFIALTAAAAPPGRSAWSYLTSIPVEIGLAIALVLLIVGLVCLVRFRRRPGEEPAEPGSLDERRVKILMVGYPGSGKTVMLASLYHRFVHGTRWGIRFVSNEETNRRLVDYADSIRDQRARLPYGTQDTTKYEFTVRAESATRNADAFVLEFLDYAGGHVEQLLRVASSEDDPVDPELKHELGTTDVLMGILDGERLVRLMRGGYDIDIVGEIERLLNVLVGTGHRNVHLVVSKWDVMRDPDGSLYTISDVREKLAAVSSAFRNFQSSPQRMAGMRIIPVAALGLNGLPRDDSPASDNAAASPWEPWNVHVPFFCAVPDVIEGDVPHLETSQSGTGLSMITLAVLTLAGLIQVGTGWSNILLRVPVESIALLVREFVGRNTPDRPPDDLDRDSALSYVVNESYLALQRFEQQRPDSRVTRPGDHE